MRSQRENTGSFLPCTPDSLLWLKSLKYFQVLKKKKKKTTSYIDSLHISVKIRHLGDVGSHL